MDRIQRNKADRFNSNNCHFQITTSEENETESNLNNDNKCDIVSDNAVVSPSNAKIRNNYSLKDCDRTCKSRHSSINAESSSNVETFLYCKPMD